MFAPAKPFQPSLIFCQNNQSLPKWSTCQVPPIGLSANIRPCRKGLREANYLASLASSISDKEKSFVTLTPRVCTIKLFTAVIVAVS